jgi:hypothetical protein
MPKTSEFEHEPHADSMFTGTMTAYTYEVESDPPHPHYAARILRSDEDWGVNCKLDLNGTLLEDQEEEYQVTVFLENLTPDETDYAFPKPPPLHVATVRGQKHYDFNVEISKGAVKVGVYKPTVLVQLYNHDTNVPWPIAAFVSLPVINIYPYTAP